MGIADTLCQHFDERAMQIIVAEALALVSQRVELMDSQCAGYPQQRQQSAAWHLW